tara:strand:- start:201 stop:452 length:252 start_codon:yes stop_codon:yes gene_type:complete
MSSFKEEALNALMLNAKKDRSEALTSLAIMLDHPAGIGDHSTGDLYNNLNEALSSLADAEDRIDCLARHYSSSLGAYLTQDND